MLWWTFTANGPAATVTVYGVSQTVSEDQKENTRLQTESHSAGFYDYRWSWRFRQEQTWRAVPKHWHANVCGMPNVYCKVCVCVLRTNTSHTPFTIHSHTPVRDKQRLLGLVCKAAEPQMLTWYRTAGVPDTQLEIIKAESMRDVKIITWPARLSRRIDRSMPVSN